jgi:hypothetical protein
MNDEQRRIESNASMLLGVVLVVLGVLFLLDQWLNISLGQYVWPLAIIVPGVLVFLWALGLREPEGLGFASFGGILIMIGLLLQWQTLTDMWASWAYAWALVAPTAVGLAHIVFGTLKNRPRLVSSGIQVTKVGLTLFLAFAAFFELVLNIDGLNIGNWAAPVALILLGVYILWRQVRPRNMA